MEVNELGDSLSVFSALRLAAHVFNLHQSYKSRRTPLARIKPPFRENIYFNKNPIFIGYFSLQQ
jgi:hypothetical protein